MTPAQYEQGLMALAAWQAAKSDNIDELLAIASVIRNRVEKFGKTYSKVCEELVKNRPFPDIRHPALIHPTSGILAAVEGIYTNDTPDYTSNHLHQEGALYFCEVMQHQGTGDEFERTILNNPAEHCLIGKFGMQHFYE